MVRPARADELSAVADLTVRAYTADGHLAPGDPYEPMLRDTVARAREAELYVAVLDDRLPSLAGTVTFCPAGSAWREVAYPDEGELRMLAVDPRVRRRGLAAALVGVCLERSRELGCAALVLSSLPTQTAAHALYAGLGFRRCGERDWSVRDGVDLLTYRLEL